MSVGSAPGAVEDGSRMPRILIVDDDPRNCDLLAHILTHEGFDYLVAAGGAEALALLGRERIDLVLLDLMMPAVDGMAVLAALRAREALPELPVVVVTAHDDRELRLEALAKGAVDFVTKPFDRAEIACRIRTLAQLKVLREQAVGAAEAGFKQSTHLLEQRFRQSPVANVVWDAEFRVAALNPAAERLFGYAQSEVIGRPAGFFASQHSRSEMEGMWRRMLSSERLSSTYENATKRGGIVVCEWHNAPLTLPSGAVGGAFSVVLDRTDQRRLEQALVQAQKMEALGKLAGGVSHDFNNILAVILTCGGFVRDALPEGDPRRADVLEILKAAERGAGLTRQLLAFAQREPTVKRAVDLNQSLRGLREILQTTLGDRIELNLSVAPEPALVRIDPVNFDQIVLNLAVNARDAMPEGGRFDIGLELTPEPGAALSGGAWVRLSVADTGSGMDAATRERIFEPFFTTKPKGKGTGLGLATCFGIVGDANGSIRVRSAPGQGSVFIIELPRLLDGLGEEREGRGSRRPLASPDAAKQVVLIIENDRAFAEILANTLAEAGFFPEIAASMRDARELLESRKEPRYMLCDLSLPDGSAAEFLEWIQSTRPALVSRVLVLAGGATDRAGERIVRSGLFRILDKGLPPSFLVEVLSGGRHFSRPLAEPVRRSSSISQPLVPRAPWSGPLERILVVEDDKSLAKAMARILGGAGFDVTHAPSLESARGKLEGTAFDAVVLDIGLPDGSGFDLLDALRGHNMGLPVVMTTGEPSVETAAKALRSRVNEYVPKPFPAEELLRVVRNAVEGGRVEELRSKLLASRFGGDEFVGDIPRTQKIFSKALASVRMVYQPIVSAVNKSVYGYEALLRCDEPTLASPVRLLAAAEVLGRVGEVGHAVRASVAATLRERSGRAEVIFVNLHPTELKADILADVGDPLLALADRVVLEVTERASLQSGPRLDDELARIRSLNYRLAVDDLGEGYAGLSSLVKIRPDIAKIDMSLVREIHRAPLKRDIVAALVDMARRADIVVVAEGVETLEECAVLVDLGCDLLQGYLFAKPGPPFPVPAFPHRS